MGFSNTWNLSGKAGGKTWRKFGTGYMNIVHCFQYSELFRVERDAE